MFLRAREAKIIIRPYNRSKSRKHHHQSQRVPSSSPSTWAACIWTTRCSNPSRAHVTMPDENHRINLIVPDTSPIKAPKIIRHRFILIEPKRTQAVSSTIRLTLQNRTTTRPQGNSPRLKTRRISPYRRHSLMTNSSPRLKSHRWWATCSRRSSSKIECSKILQMNCWLLPRV